MGRYAQTFARIGAGYAAIGSLVWLLWPESIKFADNPEAWFVFLTALVVWHFTEFKQSDALWPQAPSRNDVRVARELVQLHSRELRYLLKDTDLWSPVRSKRYSEVGEMLDRRERGVFTFQNEELDKKLSSFIEKLEMLYEKIAQDTVPEMIGGEFRTGYKPMSIVPDEEYQRRRSESQAANKFAWNAWDSLEILVQHIKTDIPEALDEPIE